MCCCWLHTGKTTQVLTFLSQLRRSHAIWGPHLVVAPLTVLSAWQNELGKFFSNQFDVHIHYGEQSQREEELLRWKQKQTQKANNYKSGHFPRKVSLVLTSYEICQRDLTMFQRIGGKSDKISWYHLIVSESVCYIICFVH
jgi:SNF2 family DNA or RNA helicase